MRNNFRMIRENFQCLIQRTADKHFHLSPTRGRREGKRAESEAKDRSLKGETLIEESHQPWKEPFHFLLKPG